MAWVALALLPAHATNGDTRSVAAQDEELVEPPTTDPEMLHVASTLRLSRRTDAPERELLLQRLAESRSGAIEPLLEVLVTGKIAKTEAEDPRQILSVPQRELVLGALARLPGSTVRAALEQRSLAVAAGKLEDTLPVWRARVWTLGAIGDEGDLEGLLTDGRGADRRALPELKSKTWRECFAPLLKRTPTAFDRLVTLWPGARPEQLRALLEATGDSADPNGLRFLASVIEAGKRDQALLAIGQIRRVGRSYDGELDRQTAEALRKWIDLERSNQTQQVLQALGEFRDRDSLALCVELLDSEDAGLRDSALWALRRSSGLTMAAARKPWTRWLGRQEREFELARAREKPKLVSRDAAQVLDAVRALRPLRIEAHEVASWIIPLLSRRHVGLRVQACESLADLDARSSVPALVEVLEDPDKRVREAAWTALQTLTGRELPLDVEAWRKLVATAPRAG